MLLPSSHSPSGSGFSWRTIYDVEDPSCLQIPPHSPSKDSDRVVRIIPPISSISTTKIPPENLNRNLDPFSLSNNQKDIKGSPVFSKVRCVKSSYCLPPDHHSSSSNTELELSRTFQLLESSPEPPIVNSNNILSEEHFQESHFKAA